MIEQEPIYHAEGLNQLCMCLSKAEQITIVSLLESYLRLVLVHMDVLAHAQLGGVKQSG